MTGIAVGAAPGIALFFIGIIVGGEAALSFGVIGILLAIVGAVVGAVIGGSKKEADRGTAPVVGAIVGAIPGLVMIFIQTRLAFPIILVGALIGWFIGTRITHEPPGVSTT